MQHNLKMLAQWEALAAEGRPGAQRNVNRWHAKALAAAQPRVKPDTWLALAAGTISALVCISLLMETV